MNSVRFPLLLCNIARKTGTLTNGAFSVAGQNSTFGAFSRVFGATNISAFVAAVPIRGPWTAGGPRTLPEARKTGFPEWGESVQKASKTFETLRKRFKTLQNALKMVKNRSETPKNRQNHPQNTLEGIKSHSGGVSR